MSEKMIEGLKKTGEFIYELEGTSAPVKLFLSDKLLQIVAKDKTIEQIKNVSMLPGVEKAFCMPDAHQGYGFPIGGVAAIDFEKGGISPGGIGYDENCGVRVMLLPIKMEDIKANFKELIDLIFKLVPTGVGGEQSAENRLSYDDLDNVLKMGARWMVNHGFGLEEDLEFCEDNGRMLKADPNNVSMRAKKRGRRQIGTLGAGNHFIEIQKISEIYDQTAADVFGLKKDYLAVMIHCGSRGLGHQVCTDYLHRIEKEFPDLVEKLPDRELMFAPAGTYLANEFFSAMSAAANFAWANRQMIMHNIRKAFNKIYGIPFKEMKLLYDVTHNIAKIEEYEINGIKKKFYIHRKGATRAFPKNHPSLPKKYLSVGQPVLIPGSMGTSSYVMYGTEKAMEMSFGSVAHGAGRAMSRFEAKKTFRYEDVKNNLEDKGISFKSASKNGIVEETAECYKDIDEVVRVIDGVGLAKKVAKLEPVGVIKG